MYRSGPIRYVSRFGSESRSYFVRRRHLVPICQKTKFVQSQIWSVKHSMLWYPGQNSQFVYICSRQKRCAAQFGAGCTDWQLEISVLGLFREKTVLGLGTVFWSRTSKCGLNNSVNRMTYDSWPMTYDLWLVTYDRYTTPNTQYPTSNAQHTAYPPTAYPPTDGMPMVYILYLSLIHIWRCRRAI